MSIFLFMDILLPFLEACMYFLLFEAFFKRRFRSNWYYFVGLVLLACLIVVINHYFLYSIYNILGIIAAALLVSFSLYRGRMEYFLMVAILNILISALAENITTSILANVFNCTAEMIVDVPELRALGILVSKAGALAICNAIRIKMKKQRLKIGDGYWFLFLFLFVLSLATVLLLALLSLVSHETRYNTWIMFCDIGLFGSTFVVLYLYEKMAKQFEFMRVQERYDQQLEFQLQHQKELLAKQEELRRFRHDQANQLTALKGYFSKKDYDGGIHYIERLQENVVEIDNASAILTGNTALDAVINSKKALAESMNITFTMRVQISNEIQLAPVDSCIIFGNALDNAIEACNRCKDDQKRIYLFLREDSQGLFCRIENTAPIQKKNSLATSKEDSVNHGLGLVNIISALARYGSEPVIEQQDGLFTLFFMIFYAK